MCMPHLFILFYSLDFSADIGRKPPRGIEQRLHAGFVDEAYTPANKTTE